MASDKSEEEGFEKYLQPLPIWRGDQWLGLGFGPVDTPRGTFWEISLVFAEADYGRLVFDAVAGWNDRQPIDRDNRVGLSLIDEPNGDYTAYLYPTLYGISLGKQVRTAMLAKPFPNPPGSHFRSFQKNYKGTPVRLTALAMNGRDVVPVLDIVPFWKAGLKMKERNALTERDREYQHGRQIIEK